MTEHSRFLGAPVYSLQTMLRAVSAVLPGVLPVIPDGFYGPNTFASVRSFQRQFGLPDTGTTDYVTWVKLVAAYRGTLPGVRGTFPFLLSAPDELTLQEQAVLLAMLQTVFRRYHGREFPEQAAALQWVQRSAGLAETGLPDPATQLALLGLYQNSVF